MDRQKQIEEMANDIAYICPDKVDDGCFDKGMNCVSCIAKYLYNAGYRKIHEDGVVLTREEYEKLDIVKEMYGSVDKVKVSDILKMFAMTDKVARKETVDKFSGMAKAKAIKARVNIDDYPRNDSFIFLSDIDEICKEIMEG